MDGYLMEPLNLEKLDMSKRNNLYLIILVTSTFLLSCFENKNKEVSEIVESKKMFEVSNRISNKDYNRVYQEANDSVNYWIENNLSAYQTEKINKWKIDSLICFNEKVNKCIMALLKSNTYFKDQTADGITYFYGVKINQKWYFFKGPYLALPREPQLMQIPRTFPQLHAIAMKEVFSGYLKKNAKGPSHGGEWEINEAFFNDFTSGAWYQGKRPDTQAEWDSVYLKVSNPWKWGKAK